MNPSEVELRVCVSLIGDEAIPVGRHDIVLRHTGAICVLEPEEVLRRHIPFSEPEPVPGLDTILRHAVAVRMCDPKSSLGVRVSLIGRGTEPPSRLAKVLGNTASVLIHNPEVELSGGEALLSRQPIPANSLCIVLRNSRAIFVIFPEDQLINRIPVGSELKPAPSLGTVLRYALAVRIADPKTTVSGRVSLVGRQSVPADCLVKVRNSSGGSAFRQQ